MRKKMFIFLSLFWIAFIFYNSLQSATESSKFSGRFVGLFQDIFNMIGIMVGPNHLSLLIRKAAHIFEFFILALLAFPVLSNNKKCYFLVILFGMIIAVIDEVIQFFVPGRCSSSIDVAIDIVGVFLAIFFRLLKKNGQTNLNIN